MKRLLQLLPALACLTAAAQEAAPADGPLVLGEHRVFADKKPAEGDHVEIRLPVMSAADAPTGDAAVCITIFKLTDELDIVPAQDVLQIPLPGAPGAWKTGEVRVLVSYTGTAGGYYGFTAELRYKGEVVDGTTSAEELLPEAGAPTDRPADVPPPSAPTEEAVPYADFLKENPDRTN